MLIACNTPQDQVQRLVGAIRTALEADLARLGHAVLAVSGGRSPIALFHALAQTPLDWPHVSVILVDERCVPANHADSNAALVRQHLLTGLAAQARFTPLVDDPADLPGCVARANARMHGTPQRITVAVLGMGDDGHTASLFPGAAELTAGLDIANPHAYLAITPPRESTGTRPQAPHARISLSLAALLNAGQLLLSMAGEVKRAVYAQASAAPPDPALPISFIIQQSQTPFDAYWTR